MEFNILKLTFTFNSFYIGFFGLIVNLYQKYLPALFVKSFLYGKFAGAGKKGTFDILVPKRWFKHFYVFSSIWSSFFLLLAGLYYLHVIHTIPSNIKYVISYLTTTNNKAKVTAMATILTLCLITLQSYRRYYETHYVSVFSNTNMAVTHYIIGFVHYFGAVIAIVVESPGFSQSGHFEDTLQVKDINFRMIAAFSVFLWAWWSQFQCGTILANLRKNKRGEVVTESHLVPYGGLFKYVSNPHSMCEIIMYISMGVILLGNSHFPFIVVWVTINQIETAVLSHWWYQKEFKNYPKNRKAIIPFIY